MEPLRFTPQFVPKIWGGRKLETVLGKELPPGNIGESWEISGHRSQLTRVAGGEMDGLTLYDLAGRCGEEIFGAPAGACRDDFPLLLKFIDASDVLSVQVHPDDDYAGRHESSLGKSEAWIIINCEPEAFLYRGFRDGASPADFDGLLAEGRLEELLRKVTVKPGDCINLPAGTVHAIGSGILLCEIQQSSDVTYRVYDWNRMGADGKPRPLHVERARDVMDFTPPSVDTVTARPAPVPGGTRESLIESDKFILERFRVDSVMPLELAGDRFHILCVLEGRGSIEGDGWSADVKPGDSFILPASTGAFTLSPSGGLMSAALSTVA